MIRETCSSETPRRSPRPDRVRSSWKRRAQHLARDAHSHRRRRVALRRLRTRSSDLAMPAWHPADDACIRATASAWVAPLVTLALDNTQKRAIGSPDPEPPCLGTGAPADNREVDGRDCSYRRPRSSGRAEPRLYRSRPFRVRRETALRAHRGGRPLPRDCWSAGAWLRRAWRLTEHGADRHVLVALHREAKDTGDLAIV